MKTTITNFLNMSLFGFTVSGVLGFIVKVLVIWVFVMLVVFLTRRAFRRMARHSNDVTRVNFLQRIVVSIIYVIGVTAFLSLIPGMQRVSDSILASAGILAMAVGLASQEALSNIISGLFIIFAHPFKVKDFINVDNSVMGTVEEITLRHTIIRSPENRMIIIPNSKINSSTIINSTIGDEHICAFIEVGVSYTTDLNFAISVMRDEIMKHPLLIDRRTPQEVAKGVPQVTIRVMELGDSSITLRAWAWTDSMGHSVVMKCDLLKAIKERFDAEHIEIPYPYFNQIVQRG